MSESYDETVRVDLVSQGVLTVDIYRENRLNVTDFRSLNDLAIFSNQRFDHRDWSIGLLRPVDLPTAQPPENQRRIGQRVTHPEAFGGISASIDRPKPKPGEEFVEGDLTNVKHWKLCKGTQIPPSISISKDGPSRKHVLITIQPGSPVSAVHTRGTPEVSPGIGTFEVIVERIFVTEVVGLPWIPVSAQSKNQQDDDKDGSAIVTQRNNDLVKSKNKVIRAMQRTKAALGKCKDEIDKCVHSSAIASTVGNGVSIASTVLLFTPFFWVGVGGLIAGGGTTVGTSITMSVLNSNEVTKIRNILDEENQLVEAYAQAALKAFATLPAWVATARITTVIQKPIVDAAIAGGKIVAESIRRGSTTSISSMSTTGSLTSTMGRTAAVAGDIAVDSGVAVGTKVASSTGSKALGVIAVGLNVLDIVLTWTMSNETSVSLGKLISEKDANIQAEIAEIPSLFESLTSEID